MPIIPDPLIRRTVLFSLLLSSWTLLSARLLIPMGKDGQTDHLKAYGIAYWALENGLEIQWLLNHEGGSFLLPDAEAIRKECLIRGVRYQRLAENAVLRLLEDIERPEINKAAVRLQKAPRIAVYSPKGKQPWDDAVTLVLS